MVRMRSRDFGWVPKWELRVGTEVGTSGGYRSRNFGGVPKTSVGYRSGDFGGVPKRSNGADCKSAGSAFGGSNPPPTILAGS